MFTKTHSQNYQKGLSSIEMVMILPFILVLYLLIANVGKFWHIKLDNQIKARTSAWRKASFNTVPCLEIVEQTAERIRNYPQLTILASYIDESVRSSINQTLFGIQGHACHGESSAGNFIRAMDVTKGETEESNSHASGLSSGFNNTLVYPYATTGRTYFLWGSWGFDRDRVFFLEETHALDIAGLWHRFDMPMGHDEYLRQWLVERKGNATSSMSEEEYARRQEEQQALEEWQTCMEANRTDCGEQPQITL